jgi:hypothetical protein
MGVIFPHPPALGAWVAYFLLVTYPPDPLPLGIDEGKGVNFLRGAGAPLFLYLPPYFLFLYLWYSSRREMLRMRDKTTGMAITHKFSSILMARRWQMARAMKVIIRPAATHPDARNIYSLTIGECNYRLRGEEVQVCLVKMGLRGSGGDLFPAPHYPFRSVFPPEPTLGASAAHFL